MLIFDAKEKRIDVYTLEGQKGDLIEYRRKLMKNQDINRLFYCLETTNETIKNRFINGDEIDIRFLEPDYTNDWFSKLSLDNWEDTLLFREKQLMHEELLSRYIYGDFSKIIPTRTFIPEDGMDCYINNFIAIGKPVGAYSEEREITLYRIEDILKLPDQLYILHLLENGRFSQISHSNINYDEQLELFNINQVDSIDIGGTKKLFELGLLQGAYEDILDKVNITRRILQRVRR